MLVAIVAIADENPAHRLTLCHHFLLIKTKIQRCFRQFVGSSESRAHSSPLDNMTMIGRQMP
jgi:hypothetical protein